MSQTIAPIDQLRTQITALRTEIIEAHLHALCSNEVVVSPQRVEELKFRMLKTRADVAQLQLLAMGDLRYRLPYEPHSKGFSLGELCQRDSSEKSATTETSSTTDQHSDGQRRDCSLSQYLEQKLATAIAAATEFKLMLDMQRPGTLFYPGRKRIDPRQSACYTKAAQDLFDLISQEHDSGQCPPVMLAGVEPSVSRVPDDGPDAVARPVDVLADVRVVLSKLGIKEIGNGGDCGEDSGFLVLGLCALSSLQKIAKLADLENGVVHKTS